MEDTQHLSFGVFANWPSAVGMQELRCIGRWRIDEDSAEDFDRLTARCIELMRASGLSAPQAELLFFIDERGVLVYAWRSDDGTVAPDPRFVAQSVEGESDGIG